jgi:hypothetical protein
MSKRLKGLVRAAVAQIAKNAWTAGFTALIALFVGAAATNWLIQPLFGAKATIDEQIAAIEHTEAARGLYLVFLESADLGAGNQSYVVVLRARAALRPTSDLIRVYDVHDGGLHLEFEYRPKPSSKTSGHTGSPYLYEYGSMTTVPGTDRHDLIGSFSTQSGDAAATEIPTVLYWNTDTQRFAIVPLFERAPRLARVRRANGDQAPPPAPVTLISSQSGSRIRGYPVNAFDLIDRGIDELPLIIGSFRATVSSAGNRELYQAMSWRLDISTVPVTYECPGAPVYFQPNGGTALARKLLFVAATNAELRNC